MKNSNFLLFLVITMLFASQAHSFTATLFDPKDGIYRGEEYDTSMQWVGKYERCVSGNSVKRGEYETKEEFENRKINSQGSCESLKTFNAEMRIDNVNLSYDADQSIFKFRFKLGRNLYSCTYVRPNGGYIESTCIANMPVFSVVKNDYSSDVTFDSIFFDSVKKAYLDVWKSGHQAYFDLEILSNIEKARILKTKENSLSIVVKGVYKFSNYYELSGSKFPECYFSITSIQLINKENNKPILLINV